MELRNIEVLGTKNYYTIMVDGTVGFGIYAQSRDEEKSKQKLYTRRKVNG